MIRLPTLVAVLTLWAALPSGPRVALAQADPARTEPARTEPARTEPGRIDPARGVSADPWSREVAVADRGPEERRAAQSLAMREVLLANSGDKTLLNRDDVRAGLRDAERYVERFEYRTPPPGTIIPTGTPLTDAVRESGEATQLMRVAFDRGLLGTLIAGDDGDEEPVADEGEEGGDPFLAIDAALMWLLIEDGRRDILVSDPAARNVRARAREIAGARGIGLRYPTGDAEDAALVGADDIRDLDVERLRTASERYAVPVVLVGRLARDGLDAWEGEWTKFAGDALERTTFTTGGLDEALQEGIGWLTSATSGGEDVYRYGGGAASDTEALVWVGALDSVAAYATVMDFLSGVPEVGTVYAKEIDERGMTFTIVPRGALPAIASAAESLAWLRRTNPPTYPDAFARGPSSPDGTASGPATLPGAGAGGAADAGRTGGRGVTSDPAPGPATGLPADARPAPPAPLARDAELAFDYLR